MPSRRTSPACSRRGSASCSASTSPKVRSRACRRSSRTCASCRIPTRTSTRSCSSRGSSTSVPTTSATASAPDGDRLGIDPALRELRRVLKPDGSLLVTVPVGEPEDYGWFRQEDVRGWTHHFVRTGFFVEELDVYELARRGGVLRRRSTGRRREARRARPRAPRRCCAPISARAAPRVSPPSTVSGGRRGDARRSGGASGRPRESS